MLTLLEFLRLHPHIAAQYERFLGGEPECTETPDPPTARENGMPILKPEASCLSSIDRHTHEMAMDATDRPSQHYVPSLTNLWSNALSPPSVSAPAVVDDGRPTIFRERAGTLSIGNGRDITSILDAPWPIRLKELPRPPAKGKLLSIPAAYKYLLGSKEALDIVLVEFFCQINKGTNTAGSCWVLNREPKRNSRGYLVKKVQIHHLAKSMPAVQLAYLLIHNKECTENLYNTCGEERCINPDHHNAGKPYCAEKKFRLRKN